MTAPRSRIPTSVLRETARLRVQALSLRKTAKEIGLSPTGLQGFLDGADPYGPTVQKLHEWYLREEVRKPMDLAPEAAGAALSLLVRHLPEPRHPAVKRRLVEVLASERHPLPESLRALLAAPEDGDDPPSPEPPEPA